MDWLIRQIIEIERRLKSMADWFARIKDWQRWVEQRLRELGGSAANIVGVSSQQNASSVADQIHATACVTTAITKATVSGTPGTSTWTLTPGVGGGMRFTAFDPTGPTLNQLTGVEEPIYSVWLDNGVKVGANVQLVWKQKAWWMADVDSCANLTS